MLRVTAIAKQKTERCFAWGAAEIADRRFIGLELSPVSVTLAKRLSERFGLPVGFFEANVCQPLPAAVPRDADLVYSSHALEMMPRTFVGAWDLVLIDGRWLLDDPDF